MPLKAEDQIDIWNQSTEKPAAANIEKNENKPSSNIGIFNATTVEKDIDIKIENADLNQSNDKNIFGLYDPAKNNFDLYMWSRTEGDKVRSSFNRINKIQLSNTAEKLFENTILSLKNLSD